MGRGVPVAAAPQALSIKAGKITIMVKKRLCFFIFSFLEEDPQEYANKSGTGSGCDAAISGCRCHAGSGCGMRAIGVSMAHIPGRWLKPILPDYSQPDFLLPCFFFPRPKYGAGAGNAVDSSDSNNTLAAPFPILDSYGKPSIINQDQSDFLVRVAARLTTA